MATATKKPETTDSVTIDCPELGAVTKKLAGLNNRLVELKQRLSGLAAAIAGGADDPELRELSARRSGLVASIDRLRQQLTATVADEDLMMKPHAGSGKLQRQIRDRKAELEQVDEQILALRKRREQRVSENVGKLLGKEIPPGVVVETPQTEPDEVVNIRQELRDIASAIRLLTREKRRVIAARRQEIQGHWREAYQSIANDIAEHFRALRDLLAQEREIGRTPLGCGIVAGDLIDPHPPSFCWSRTAAFRSSLPNPGQPSGQIDEWLAKYDERRKR